MENNLSIEQIFNSPDNNEIYKSKPSVALAFLLVAAGIALIAVNSIIHTLSTVFILAGIGLLMGAVYVFFKKTGYKLSRNNERITFREIYFDVKERDRLINILNGGIINELEKLKPANIDALKLRIAATRDGSFCYSQVVSYVPY